MNGNSKQKNSEKFKKYQMYFEPVVIIGLDFRIIAKNSAARYHHVKLQINNNIRRVLNAENTAKLDNTIKNGGASFIEIDIPSPLNRCIAVTDEVEGTNEFEQINREKVIVLIFFNSVNLTKSDRYYTDSLFHIIEAYNARTMVLKDSVTYGLGNLKTSFNSENEDEIKKYLQFVTANHQKIVRLQNRLNAYINNVKNVPDEYEKKKNYCDIFKFCENLQRELPKYLQSNGYNMKSDIQDEIFIVKLCEKDFLLLNLIIITFIAKYSAVNTINLRFSMKSNDGLLRYEFPLRDEFSQFFRNKFTAIYTERLKDGLGDISDNDWLDLHLASVIAHNNDSLIDIKTDFNSDENKVFIDIIIRGKGTDALELKNFIVNSFDFMSEQVQNMVAAEFSVLGEYIRD